MACAAEGGGRGGGLGGVGAVMIGEGVTASSLVWQISCIRRNVNSCCTQMWKDHKNVGGMRSVVPGLVLVLGAYEA